MCVAVISNDYSVRKRLKNLVSFLNFEVHGYSDIICLMDSIAKNKEKIDSIILHTGKIFDKIAFKSLLLSKQLFREIDIVVISNKGLAMKNDYRYNKSILDMGFAANLYENDENLDSKLTDILKKSKENKKKDNKHMILKILVLFFLSTTISSPFIFTRAKMNEMSDKIYRETKIRVVNDYLETRDFMQGDGEFRGGVVIVDTKDTLYINFKNNKEQLNN